MAKLSKLVFIPPVIFAALGGLFFGGMMRDRANELPSTFVGQAAPVLPGDAIPGTALFTAADMQQGEVTIVNFWGSWCPPCRAEHPILLDLAEKGYRVAGVNFRETPQQAADYLTEQGNPFFATAIYPPGRTGVDWGVTAPPETFIVAGDGTVLFKFIGPLIGSDFEQRFMPELIKATGG